MCFTLSNLISEEKERVATEDIVCYKVLVKFKKQNIFTKNKVKSLYREFVYRLGKTYSKNRFFKLKINYDNEIYEGFHSYIKKEHWLIRHNLKMSKNYILVQCIIPKGSKYYINTDQNLYVSNQIKLLNETTI